MSGMQPARTPAWTTVGRVDDIPLRGARVVRTDGGDIAVFRTQSGAVHAIADRCPHRAGPLSQGIVHDGRVTCPLHNLVVDLETGVAQGPEQLCVRVYPVRIEDGRVVIDVAGRIKPAPEGRRADRRAVA